MAQQIRIQAMGAREWTLLLALSVLWGASFYFFKILDAEMPPFTLVLGRVGLAALALNAVVLGRGDLMPTSPKQWRGFLIMGLFMNVIPFTLIAYGETGISSGLASILNATTPILTVLVAHVFTHNEKLSWAKATGVLMGFLGVAVLVGPGALFNFGGDGMINKLACLGAAASYALGGVYAGRFRSLPSIKLATGQITASVAIMVPLVLIFDHPWTQPMPSIGAWGAWIGISMLGTALAYLIYFRIQATAGVTNIVLVTFLVPISALMFGVFLLGETITSQSIGGMVLIGLGLAAIDGRLWRAVASLGRPPKKAGDQVS